MPMRRSKKIDDCPSLPTNGYELETDAASWESDEVRKHNNCYAYAVNSRVPHRRQRMQPGNQCGNITRIGSKDYNCETMRKRLLRDFAPSNPSCGRRLVETQPDEPCPRGSYKIAMLVDPGKDYHFYRQGRDGKWTHKRGNLNVFATDASDKPIVNPERACANHDWGKYNYTDFCGFYCVQRNADADRDTSDPMVEDVTIL